MGYSAGTRPLFEMEYGDEIMEKDRSDITRNVMPRMHSDEAHARREAYVRDLAKGVVKREFSEMIHEAKDILAHGDRYPDAVVKRQTHVLDVIYSWGMGIKMTPSEIDRIAEDEYHRRQDELARRDRDTS